MVYTIKTCNLVVEFDNFDDFVEALREEAESRESNRHIGLHIEILNP